MILPLYVSLEKIDPRLIEATKDLYSSNTRSFTKVILPLSMPGVLAGSMLVFIPAAGDFINADYLGSTQTTMIGNVIQQQFLVVKDYPAAAALIHGADGDHPGRRAAVHPGARNRGPGMTTQAGARGRRRVRPTPTRMHRKPSREAPSGAMCCCGSSPVWCCCICSCRSS